ncbi:conserved hypothetical protein [Lodderomyces elongisporus NRRL YB-4239]|uniref:Zn(2)-C6 fungal-type domain-containing protein n=1 Tax=Lodderomyces elongisporus (strain ATCC 11503 / CBS 2605 / JCM 1781 / NBRC 1676 / NRRL YB-4239) TaxID=379508 RepID=A5DZN7_LODEL|nr:conserved hypothetical protein [Lodderomyces elongisporus NRRL YB-4239]
MPQASKRRLSDNEATSMSPSSSSNSSSGNKLSVSTNKTTPAPKKLSCQRCRLRKMRCDFNNPCLNCKTVGVECIETTQDMRKKRPPATYVKSLEAQVQSIKSFIQSFRKLKNTNDQIKYLQNTDILTDVLQMEQKNGLIPSSMGVDSPLPHPHDPHDPHDHHDHHDEIEENKAIYGPTSVYGNSIITNNRNNSNATSSTSKRETEVLVINTMNKDPEILQCLHLFFTWQYPDHNMFIFREAFLIDFFNPTPTSLYCSKVLVLSICALGSRMAIDEKIHHKSKQYYRELKTLLLNTMSQPSITSLQSFLLLAFFDICNGLNSSGWMLSGNAMRMGFDIGFQLNPEVWFVKSKESLNKLDVEIRSRIYWGCFMADHFISLVLGRPSILKLSDASIPVTSDLPDLEWIDDFTYNGYLKNKEKEGNLKRKKLEVIPSTATKAVSYISDPLNQIINLINISDNMLNDIFTKSDLENERTNNFNSNSNSNSNSSNSSNGGNATDDLDLTSRLGKVFDYNWQIMQWKEKLPSDLQWDRESLVNTGENPTYSGIRYYYYILILCLNRPFIGLESESFPTNNHLSPLPICLNAIDDLYASIQKFELEHGYKRASIFIVYASILSISIILLTNSSISQTNEHSERLQFFMGVLRGCSRTWKLAEKSYNMIKEKLKQSYDSDDLKGVKNQSEELFRTTMKNEIEDVENPMPNSEMHYAPLVENSDSIDRQISPTSSAETQNFSNADMLLADNIDFFGGPPVLMTSDLFNEDWEQLFPDYIFHSRN